MELPLDRQPTTASSHDERILPWISPGFHNLFSMTDITFARCLTAGVGSKTPFTIDRSLSYWQLTAVNPNRADEQSDGGRRTWARHI